MFKKICHLMIVGLFLFFVSGCALINTAISAGIAYGIYKATSD